MAERPRDRLGRPLPIGTAPEDAAPPVMDVTGLDDAAVWAVAMDCLGQGMPFHAHEVFEQRWRTCPSDDRAAWRALAQWGAAVTHVARGNDEGARRLARRALETLGSAPCIPTCIDVEAVRASCRDIASDDPGGRVSD